MLVTPEPSLWDNLREGFQLAGAAIALLFALWQVVRAIMFNPIWPGREGWGRGWNRWGATAPALPEGAPFHGDIQNVDANRGWRGSAGERWCTMRAMQVGDFYRLNLGKRRVVSRIRVVHFRYGTPRRWGFAYQATSDSAESPIIEYAGPMVLDFAPPIDIYALRFTVIEPNLDEDDTTIPAWSIYDIEVTEVRLFRHWWHAIVR